MIDAAEEMDSQVIRNIIDASPKRLQRCVDANGENVERAHALENVDMADSDSESEGEQ